jgi:hypothetical protein
MILKTLIQQSPGTFTRTNQQDTMSQLNLFKTIILALTCAATLLTTAPARADELKAHAGTTFTLIPVEFDNHGNPTKFTHTVDGVVRVSQIGNCTVHFDVVVVPHPDGTFTGVATFRITSADGQTTLDGEGVAKVTPAEPGFGDFHYDVKFVGGTGLMTNARGVAQIDGFAMFTSQSAGKATWLMHGHLTTHSRRN